MLFRQWLDTRSDWHRRRSYLERGTVATVDEVEKVAVLDAMVRTNLVCVKRPGANELGHVWPADLEDSGSVVRRKLAVLLEQRDVGSASERGQKFSDETAQRARLRQLARGEQQALDFLRLNVFMV